MVQPQKRKDSKPNKRKAPKSQNIQPVYQERTSPFIPEAISLHNEDEAVEEWQSYAMVTGLLQVLMVSIAYQRGFFPKSCFKPRSPSSTPTKAHDSYERPDTRSNLTSSNNEVALFATELAQRHHQHQPLMMLVSEQPEQTSGVDRLLAWLDEIFKALLDRSLDGAQFSIYADKSKPSEVLEFYTFSFQYRTGKDGQRRLTGLTTPGHGNGGITTRNLRTDMVNVIDQLNNYQQHLPPLPRERYLMCHLFHSPHTHRYHWTAGFHTCTDTNMAVIENGSWTMGQRSFGSIDSGSHRMGLEVAFMTPTDAAKDLDHRSMPFQNMEYTRTVRRTVKPALGRSFDSQVAPQGASHTTDRPRGGSKRPLSKDSGEIITTQIVEAQKPSALPTWEWKLLMGKALEMDVKKNTLQWYPDGDDRVVRCECSCDREEVPMLRCICCQKLQHYYCYGFAKEMRVPEHHCYQCLFEDTDGTSLRDLQSLAIFRRALWILYKTNPSSPADFAQELHFDVKTTQGLIERLDVGGYLATGRTRISPVTTEEQLQIREHLYEDPLTSIDPFYEIREDIEDGNPRRKRVRI